MAFHKALAPLLILTMAATTSAQQARPSLSRQEAAIRDQADHLDPHAPITLLRRHAPTLYGNFINNDDDGIALYDIDHHADIKLPYAQIRKIKDGYGGYNSVQQTHTNHTRATVIIAITAAALIALITAAAITK